MEGVPELRDDIIRHATNKEVAIRLPNSYVQLLEKLKKYGENNPTTPIVPRSAVGSVVGKEIHAKFADDDEVDAALELLHLVGENASERIRMFTRFQSSLHWRTQLDITHLDIRQRN